MTEPKHRIGFFYSPNSTHYTQRDLARWLPELKAMGATWLTLRTPASRAIPEPFVRGLLEAGIKPFIHIPAAIGQCTVEEIDPILRSYVSWGVEQVALYDRPNVRASWPAQSWSLPDLVGRFVDHMLPWWSLQMEVGVQPIFPPMEPGGDFWDTAFFEEALLAISRRGHRAIVQNLALAVYAWTYGKPLDWGQGGPRRWSEARPYHTPQGCQDQRGLHISEWYAAISDRMLGRTLPMYVVAGGEKRSAHTSPLSDSHAERSLSIMRLFEQGQLPHLQNFAFYLLTADEDHPAASDAWFPQNRHPAAAVAAFKRFAASDRKEVQAVSGKPLEHYVLLPRNTRRDVAQDWFDLAPFALTVKPTIGFDPDEARHAKRVTIIGAEQDISREVQQALKDAGCMVERFTNPEGSEILEAASALAAAQSPLGEQS